METIIIKTDKEKRLKITEFLNALQVSFTVSKKDEKPYNPEFVERILKSREQHKQGKGRVVSIDDLWK